MGKYDTLYMPLANYSTFGSGRNREVSAIWLEVGVGQLSKNFQNNSWLILDSSLDFVAQ